jgi:nucleotide-binding universal stress UspA family protein
VFKNILVCLDGSEIAEKILPVVKEQALAMGSKVTLLHVVNLPGNVTLGVPGFPSVPLHTASMPEHLKKDFDSAEQYLKNTEKQLVTQGIQANSQTLIGLPGPSIISYAAENAIDMIALVTHGHGGLRNVLLGSVAEHIIKESGLPIILVHAVKGAA